MKTLKTLASVLFAIALLLTMVSCDKDKDFDSSHTEKTSLISGNFVSVEICNGGVCASGDAVSHVSWSFQNDNLLVIYNDNKAKEKYKYTITENKGGVIKGTAIGNDLSNNFSFELSGTTLKVKSLNLSKDWSMIMLKK